MESDIHTAAPIIGKTYSLYGGESSSDNFYETLSACAYEALRSSRMNAEQLLQCITYLSSSRSRIKKETRKDAVVSGLMDLLKNELSRYITNLKEHLESLTLFQRIHDRRLGVTYEQYLLYMLEIELTNRINRNSFSAARTRMAFLPHCLRDFSKECLSIPDEVDHLCRRCSKKCTINSISTLLKQNNVLPYIWLKADLKKLFTDYLKRDEKIGVLGIACIPELVNGMRLCRKAGVPVIGVPLDANRCRRWIGDFYSNSVNTSELNYILNGSS